MHSGFKPALRGIGTVLLLTALIGCNGTSNTVASTASTPTVLQANHPPPALAPPPTSAPPPASLQTQVQDVVPQISGTPPTMAIVNRPFSFQPKVSASSGPKLTFSVAGKPSWTSFDTCHWTVVGHSTTVRRGRARTGRDQCQQRHAYAGAATVCADGSRAAQEQLRSLLRHSLFRHAGRCGRSV